MSLSRRRIPKLQVLCLRAIGSHSCCTEATFGGKKAKSAKERTKNDPDLETTIEVGSDDTGTRTRLGSKNKRKAPSPSPEKKARDSELEEPTMASRLLRSFHTRPVDDANATPAILANAGDDENDGESTRSMHKIPLHRTPCIGTGSARRVQPNEIDLNHPIVACRHFAGKANADNDVDVDELGGMLVMQYGSPALDCLQSYIDSLVELGRMDDTRLGKHFFMEWRRNVLLADGKRVLPAKPVIHEQQQAQSAAPSRKSNKRRKGKKKSSSKSAAAAVPEVPLEPAEPPSLGSLSLFNCSIASDTIAAMVESGMGEHLGVLDLSGIHPLTDELLGQLFPNCPNLLRLSIKNCRRLTRQTMVLIGSYTLKLRCLDVGGSYNIAPRDLLDTVPYLPDLVDLLASGLQWTDAMVSELNTRAWQGLSLGFCPSVTESSIKTITTTPSISSSLRRLSLPFCEALVDHALLGFLGRNAPNVTALDLRGDSGVSSLTGWYDGRASANWPSAPLCVLARFTSITRGSVEDTKRIHPLEASQLVVVLDSMGVGLGVTEDRGNPSTTGEADEAFGSFYGGQYEIA